MDSVGIPWNSNIPARLHWTPQLMEESKDLGIWRSFRPLNFNYVSSKTLKLIN